MYPDICLLCGNDLLKGEQIICSICIYKLPKTDFHKSRPNVLNELFVGRLEIEQVASFLSFRKEGSAQELIHHFKYKNRKEIGFFMGQLYAHELNQTNWIKNIDCIIPIPLHPQKLKKRGYNQSEEFAAGLSSGLGIPLKTDILERIKFSETQTRKTKYKRWENVKGIFEVRNPESMMGQHVLLVDDVLTTGSTIEAASVCLQQKAKVKISVVTLAYAAR